MARPKKNYALYFEQEIGKLDARIAALQAERAILTRAHTDLAKLEKVPADRARKGSHAAGVRARRGHPADVPRA